MRNIKKAQTATEYLVILAVVIVIALIVVGVMGGIPSIGGGASEQAVRAALSSADVGVDAYVITPFSVYMRLVNNQASLVRITSISIDSQSCNLVPSTLTLNVGQSKTIICNNITNNDLGSKDSPDIVITWTNVQTEATYTQEGDSLKLVGSVVAPDCKYLGNGVHNLSGSIVYCTRENNYMFTPTIGDNGAPNDGSSPQTFAWYSGGASSNGLNCSQMSDFTDYPICNACESLEYAGFDDWHVPEYDGTVSGYDYTGANGEFVEFLYNVGLDQGETWDKSSAFWIDISNWDSIRTSFGTISTGIYAGSDNVYYSSFDTALSLAASSPVLCYRS